MISSGSTKITLQAEAIFSINAFSQACRYIITLVAHGLGALGRERWLSTFEFNLALLSWHNSYESSRMCN